MRVLLALLLLPLAASAQDMPLFTFTKSGEGWVTSEGKKPVKAAVETKSYKGGWREVTLTIGEDRYTVDHYHQRPLMERPYTWADLKRPQSADLNARVRTSDKGTVYVGFSSETAVWAFTPDKDNKLVNGAPYAPLRIRKGYDNSKGTRDKMKASPPTLAVHELALDTAGRLYAATSQDLQVFDPTGWLSGVLTLPAKGKVDAMAWEGKKRDTLAVWIEGVKWTRAMNP
jgi:hypothetical protein